MTSRNPIPEYYGDTFDGNQCACKVEAVRELEESFRVIEDAYSKIIYEIEYYRGISRKYNEPDVQAFDKCLDVITKNIPALKHMDLEASK